MPFTIAAYREGDQFRVAEQDEIPDCGGGRSALGIFIRRGCAALPSRGRAEVGHHQ